jgi:hypothetical protein
VLGGAQRQCDPLGGFQFGVVTLAVIERQAIAGKALAAGNGEAGGGIESTGEENDSRLHHGAAIYLK